MSKQAEESKQKGRQPGAPGGLDDGDQLLPRPTTLDRSLEWG